MTHLQPPSSLIVSRTGEHSNGSDPIRRRGCCCSSVIAHLCVIVVSPPLRPHGIDPLTRPVGWIYRRTRQCSAWHSSLWIGASGRHPNVVRSAAHRPGLLIPIPMPTTHTTQRRREEDREEEEKQGEGISSRLAVQTPGGQHPIALPHPLCERNGHGDCHSVRSPFTRHPLDRSRMQTSVRYA